MNNSKKIIFISFASKLLFIACIVLIITNYFNETSLPSINETIDVKYNGTCPVVFVNLKTINNIDENGWTALMKAALQGDICEAEALIKNGADLNIRSTNIDPRTNMPAGNTALHFALYMAGKGSNISRVDIDACHLIAQMLIDAGADVYVKNNMGETPIHFAIQIINLNAQQGIQYDKRAAMLSSLIKAGGDINAQNLNGDTYTHLSIRNFERNWMKTLKDYYGSIVDFNIKNKAGQTPEDLSINLGFTDLRDFLRLPAKVIGVKDVNERDIMGMNGVMLATIRQDVPFIAKMVGHGVDMNAKTADKDLNSALHIALLHQRVSMVKALLDYNANPNQPNAYLDYPLHYVLKLSPFALRNVGSQRNQAAQFLLENNNSFGPANINAQNSDGNTVLHLAVLINAVELVDFLIKNYAARINPFIKNGNLNSGKTALELARSLDQNGYARSEIIRLLEMLEASKQFSFSVKPK